MNHTANKSELIFKSFISSYVKMENWEWEIISKKMTHKTLKKNDYLLKEGQVCDKIWFITNGLIRYFHIDTEENQRTTCFALSNNFSTSFYSYLKSEPSKENLIALENSDIIEFSKKDFLDITESIPSINLLYRKVLEKALIDMEHINYTLLHYNALERYKILILKEAPQLLKKVPLIHIASFLGISPETLSRVRANSFK